MQLSCLVMFTSTASAQPDSSNSERYDIKTCKIVYKFSNGMQEGIRTLIFDSWGDYKKETTQTNMLTFAKDDPSKISVDSFKSNIMIIRTPKSIYKLDIDKRTGTKVNIQNLPFSREALKSSRITIGKDTFLNRPCEIIEIDGAIRLWMWNKIPLKKQLIPVVNGIVIEESAISIDENYSVSSAEFDVPGNIIVNE